MQSDWCVLSNAEGYSNQALRMEAGFEPLGIGHHALFILHSGSPLQPFQIFPMSTMSVSPRTRNEIRTPVWNGSCVPAGRMRPYGAIRAVPD